jgi:hypothetical protein
LVRIEFGCTPIAGFGMMDWWVTFSSNERPWRLIAFVEAAPRPATP